MIDREYTLLPMDREEYAEIPGGKEPRQERQRRGWGISRTTTPRCRLILAVCVLLGVGVVLVVGLTLGLRAAEPRLRFREEFTARCQAFVKAKPQSVECEQVWSAFESAYVGKDPCNVPMEAYDPLISAVPFEPTCNRMMFWSKTKVVVHELTEKKDCYVTLEDSLLGSVLDGLTWCGQEGSGDTLTSGCPGWTQCYNNPVRSFWNRASAGFAEAACGDVTSMLNGSIAAPFDANSIFGSIEVQRFNSTRVKSLNVILVTKESPGTDCSNPSLLDLQKHLDPGLKYKCMEVAEANITACATNPETPCGACW